jgi:hypothetical protein
VLGGGLGGSVLGGGGLGGSVVGGGVKLGSGEGVTDVMLGEGDGPSGSGEATELVRCLGRPPPDRLSPGLAGAAGASVAEPGSGVPGSAGWDPPRVGPVLGDSGLDGLTWVAVGEPPSPISSWAVAMTAVPIRATTTKQSTHSSG